MKENGISSKLNFDIKRTEDILRYLEEDGYIDINLNGSRAERYENCVAHIYAKGYPFLEDFKY